MGSIPEIPVGAQLSSTANNNNNNIPLLGYGTASWPFGEAGEIVKESILTAIKLGYRHFDAAAVYQSEQCLGEAISLALDTGLIKSRSELFITSKLWCSDVHPRRVLPGLQNTLQKLGLEYLDLYLIHFPISMKPEGGYAVPFSQSDLLPMDFKSVWEAMEECHKLGLTKNIGVSNFSSKKIEQLLLTANIPPAVNQSSIGMGSIPEIPVGALLSSTANNNNNTIPLIGFGTASWPFGESEEILKESILTAIKLGYRHFDAAAVYQSEQCLGEAISLALDSGLIESRSELFITSKLWCSDVHPHLVLPALQNTLQKLGLEYLDLYLIHFPISMKPEVGYAVPFSQSDLLPMDFKSVWEAMEECHKLGLTKNIGVSNFSSKKIKQLLLTANIPPAVNQVEMNPVWQQKKLRKFCEEKGIHVSAYSPLGAKGTLWGTDQVMDCEILKEIAQAKGKTLAQVCLRWVYEQGASVLVKSFNKKRIEENLDIFGWMLSPEESEKIDKIPQRKGSRGVEFVSDSGPFKSVEELWDEEIDLNVTE